MKKNIMIIVAFILGLIISGIGVYAISVASKDVSYDGEKSNVQDAIDDLYSKVNNSGTINKKFCKLKSGTANTVGAKYECDPGDGIERNFYILTVNNDNTVDLIMDRNINNGTMLWKNAMKYFRTGDGANIKNAWLNVMNIDLPKVQAIVDATGRTDWIASDSGQTWWCFGSKAQDKNTSPYCNASTNAPYAWLFNNLIGCTAAGCTDASEATADGYWTRDLIYNSKGAWGIRWRGCLYDYAVDDSSVNGVRPVITVLKGNLYE